MSRKFHRGSFRNRKFAKFKRIRTVDIFYSIVDFFVRAAPSCSRSCSWPPSAPRSRSSATSRSRGWASGIAARGPRSSRRSRSGDFDKAREMTSKDDTAISRLLAHGSGAAGRRAAARRRREGDGGEHDGDHSAAREAHALPRHVRESRDAARPARHRQRPDPRVRRGRDGESRPRRRTCCRRASRRP